MFDEKYKKEFSNITKLDLIQALEEVPGNPIVNIIGENMFYMHVEEDGTVINLDDNSLEDEYGQEEIIEGMTVSDLIDKLSLLSPERTLRVNGKYQIYITVIALDHTINIDTYPSAICGFEWDDYERISSAMHLSQWIHKLKRNYEPNTTKVLIGGSKACSIEIRPNNSVNLISKCK